MTWDPTGPAQPDGTVGGDGAGEAVSIRYLNPDVPGAVITSYWYVVDRIERGWDTEDDGYRFDVEQQVELILCTDIEDPGGTETWSNIGYAHPFDVSWETEEVAIEKRDHAAKLENVPGAYTWNGQPFEGPVL